MQAGNVKLSEAAAGESLKQGVFKKFANFTEKTCVGVLSNKVGVLRACNFIKEDSNTGAFLWNFQTF